MEKKEVLEMFKKMQKDDELKKEFFSLLIETLDLRKNPFHPLIFIDGNPKIGKNVGIGLFSEIYAQDSEIVIGDNCDIASFVSINVSDSHKKCMELKNDTERKPVTLEHNVFVGSHSFISGETHIGHHCVVGAGTILINAGHIPPYSLIIGNPAVIKKEYFLEAGQPDTETEK